MRPLHCSTRSACRIPAPERTSRRRALRCCCNGVGCGSACLQRSSVYWPTNHEAGPHDPGIAVIRGHTAVPGADAQDTAGDSADEPAGDSSGGRHLGRCGLPAGVREDVAALRTQADVVVASCHWGLGKDVLAYMREIAHAAIDAGADIVVGHGPHYSLPVEAYRGKPIFYGLGSFSFHTGHGGRRHGDWIGMMARARFAGHGWWRQVSISSATMIATRRCRARWRRNWRNCDDIDSGARHSVPG